MINGSKGPSSFCRTSIQERAFLKKRLKTSSMKSSQALMSSIRSWWSSQEWCLKAISFWAKRTKMETNYGELCAWRSRLLITSKSWRKTGSKVKYSDTIRHYTLRTKNCKLSCNLTWRTWIWRWWTCASIISKSFSRLCSIWRSWGLSSMEFWGLVFLRSSSWASSSQRETRTQR